MNQLEYHVVPVPLELSELAITEFYLVMLPLPIHKASIQGRRNALNKMSHMVASSARVRDFRVSYLRHIAGFDKNFGADKNHLASSFSIWHQHKVNPKIRPLLSHELDKLSAQSRFSFRGQEHNDYAPFMLMFSALPENELELALDSQKHYWTELLSDFCSKVTLEYMQQLTPLLNFKIISPRCIEIMQLIADGHTSAEVSKQLYLTERGINYHLDRAKELIGAKNRIHLISMGYKQSLLK